MNEVYVIEDGDGGPPLYKCECGWSSRGKFPARDHYAAKCHEPKEWEPPVGQAASPSMELDVLKRELTAAIEAARQEGERVGYNSGLAVAYQLVVEVRRSAVNQGANALVPVLDEMKNQLDGFVLLAHQKLMDEGDGS